MRICIDINKVSRFPKGTFDFSGIFLISFTPVCARTKNTLQQKSGRHLTLFCVIALFENEWSDVVVYIWNKSVYAHQSNRRVEDFV